MDSVQGRIPKAAVKGLENAGRELTRVKVTV